MKPYNLEVSWSANDYHTASTALKACKLINPENPIAAAEAMPEIFRLLQDAVADAFKVTHKRLDPHKWLNEANAAILKALEKEER